MEKNKYQLQYYIYTIALHRYLKLRKKDYNYNRDFGGVLYVFLRGFEDVSSDGQRGVYFNKPDKKIIEALDKYFAGDN